MEPLLREVGEDLEKPRENGRFALDGGRQGRR
jgi:hypothetical protein